MLQASRNFGCLKMNNNGITLKKNILTVLSMLQNVNKFSEVETYFRKLSLFEAISL
jgi:hypothetical protein